MLLHHTPKLRHCVVIDGDSNLLSEWRCGDVLRPQYIHLENTFAMTMVPHKTTRL
jgi:hypothetical protein